MVKKQENVTENPITQDKKEVVSVTKRGRTMTPELLAKLKIAREKAWETKRRLKEAGNEEKIEHLEKKMAKLKTGVAPKSAPKSVLKKEEPQTPQKKEVKLNVTENETKTVTKVEKLPASPNETANETKKEPKKSIIPPPTPPSSDAEEETVVVRRKPKKKRKKVILQEESSTDEEQVIYIKPPRKGKQFAYKQPMEVPVAAYNINYNPFHNRGFFNPPQ